MNDESAGKVVNYPLQKDTGFIVLPHRISKKTCFLASEVEGILKLLLPLLQVTKVTASCIGIDAK